MDIVSLAGATCVIGISYFDERGELLKRSQLCGSVVKADAEEGIVVALNPAKSTVLASDAGKSPHFNLPPNLAPWFRAPEGRYQDPESGAEIINPDYLVAWDVTRSKAAKADGEHQWWEWTPCLEQPQVGQP